MGATCTALMEATSHVGRSKVFMSGVIQFIKELITATNKLFFLMLCKLAKSLKKRNVYKRYRIY
jgi:hypothetical protein